LPLSAKKQRFRAYSKAAECDDICTVDAKIQITITTAHLIRINYPLSSFNHRLSGTNIANFNKKYCTVSEQQLFKNGT